MPALASRQVSAASSCLAAGSARRVDASVFAPAPCRRCAAKISSSSPEAIASRRSGAALRSIRVT
jgi:hypothetical protein